MRHVGATGEAGRRAFPAGLLTASALFWITGCNSCVSFVSNPPTATLNVKAGDAKVSCPLGKANGTVRVQFTASAEPSAGAGGSRIEHVFVSLRGIDAHPSTIADEDSPDWQELAPRLAERPVQVDLMQGSGGENSPEPFGEGIVPAGVYRRLRLRLVPHQPGSGEPAPEENRCGSVGFHCVVTADGRIRPLALDGTAPELHISPQNMEGGSFLVLPDAAVNLRIEWKSQFSVVPVSDAIRLSSGFMVRRADGE